MYIEFLKGGKMLPKSKNIQPNFRIKTKDGEQIFLNVSAAKNVTDQHTYLYTRTFDENSVVSVSEKISDLSLVQVDMDRIYEVSFSKGEEGIISGYLEPEYVKNFIGFINNKNINVNVFLANHDIYNKYNPTITEELELASKEEKLVSNRGLKRFEFDSSTFDKPSFTKPQNKTYEAKQEYYKTTQKNHGEMKDFSEYSRLVQEASSLYGQSMSPINFEKLEDELKQIIEIAEEAVANPKNPSDKKDNPQPSSEKIDEEQLRERIKKLEEEKQKLEEEHAKKLHDLLDSDKKQTIVFFDEFGQIYPPEKLGKFQIIDNKLYKENGEPILLENLEKTLSLQPSIRSISSSNGVTIFSLSYSDAEEELFNDEVPILNPGTPPLYSNAHGFNPENPLLSAAPNYIPPNRQPNQNPISSLGTAAGLGAATGLAAAANLGDSGRTSNAEEGRYERKLRKRTDRKHNRNIAQRQIDAEFNTAKEKTLGAIYDLGTQAVKYGGLILAILTVTGALPIAGAAVATALLLGAGAFILADDYFKSTLKFMQKPGRFGKKLDGKIEAKRISAKLNRERKKMRDRERMTVPHAADMEHEGRRSEAAEGIYSLEEYEQLESGRYVNKEHEKQLKRDYRKVGIMKTRFGYFSKTANGYEKLPEHLIPSEKELQAMLDQNAELSESTMDEYYTKQLFENYERDKAIIAQNAEYSMGKKDKIPDVIPENTKENIISDIGGAANISLSPAQRKEQARREALRNQHNTGPTPTYNFGDDGGLSK